MTPEQANAQAAIIATQLLSDKELKNLRDAGLIFHIASKK